MAELPLLPEGVRDGFMREKPVEIFTLHARVQIAGRIGWEIHENGQFIGYDGEIVPDQAAFVTICHAIAGGGSNLARALLSGMVSDNKEQRAANLARAEAVVRTVQGRLDGLLREVRDRL